MEYNNEDFAKGMQKTFSKMLQPGSLERTASAYGPKTDSDYRDHKVIDAELKNPTFKDFVNRGYASEDGYAIRINPRTHQKEMFIAGTRHGSQWLLNVLDAGLYVGDKLLSKIANSTVEVGLAEMTGQHIPFDRFNIKLLQHLDRPRHKKEKFFADIIEREGVDVVFGHSRGGAMVADLDISQHIQKVGLDSAMMIASNTDMINYNEGGGYNPLGLFDKIIGLTGGHNVHYDASPLSFHQAWLT